MEIGVKNESLGSFSSVSFCHACLSTDRALSSVSKYVDILNKICELQCTILRMENAQLCWECLSLLNKVKLFAEKIADSQKILESFVKNAQDPFPLSLSKLTSSQANTDFITLIYKDIEIKPIKLETELDDDFETFDNFDYCTDVKDEPDVKPDKILEKEDDLSLGPFSCRICLARFPSAGALAAHAAAHGARECRVCGLARGAAPAVLRHLAAHDRMVQCLACGLFYGENKKLDSNEEQDNVVQCSSSQNLENVQLEQNQFLTQQLRIYEESHECITPKVILHRITDIPGDGNCLFHSLKRVLQLQISTCDLRRQLLDSPYLNSCQNPQEAYNILSSNNEFGDLDCLYLFAKNYNQNICVHFHYSKVISINEDTRFCHFKANDTHNWIHLDLRALHFTPYLSDDEKKKEDEERKERKKERNKRYQKAWRQRQKDLKKKVSKEEKNEEKRKRQRANQRAYYYRTKGLKGDDENVEELFQKKLDDLQMKKKKLDSNEDQENIVQCRASQNLENVQLEQNQFLIQQLRIYEESHECISPEVILHRITDIPDDGNCLFHSLKRVLQLQISTCDLRRQLLDSPYLNSCQNPQEAYNILSSNNEYGDLDCLYLFAKIYNQNICVHYHYFKVVSKNEDTRFCHFKANDTHNWIHLDLRELHFTPYLSDDEKMEEDERKRKQKNKEYSKRYRDKKKGDENKRKQKNREYSKRYRDKKRTSKNNARSP